MLETSAFESLQLWWPIHIINRFDKTKLSCVLIFPLLYGVRWQLQSVAIIFELFADEDQYFDNLVPFNLMFLRNLCPAKNARSIFAKSSSHVNKWQG